MMKVQTKHKRALLMLVLAMLGLSSISYTKGMLAGIMSYQVAGVVDVQTIIGAMALLLLVLTYQKNI